MKAGWTNPLLGDVAEINPDIDRPTDDTPVSFVPMAALDAASGRTVGNEFRPFGSVAKGYSQFRRGDLLVAKITPCFENGKLGRATIRHDIGAGSTEFHVVRPDIARLDPSYALHFLRLARVRKAGKMRMTGSAGQQRVPEQFLAALPIPLPPLAEQLRIARVLDVASSARVSRQRSLTTLARLRQAFLFELLANGNMARVAFGDLLVAPLGNGISPAAAGTHHGAVLTLSALRGDEFDACAQKLCLFAKAPAQRQLVTHGIFLVSRGNGNLSLVGAGAVAPADLSGVAYPDTMIGAHVDSRRVTPAYLETLWGSAIVRRQIESLATTTNGTFKINQSKLAAVELPLPAIDRQIAFSRVANRAARHRRIAVVHLARLDELFAALQHRAFTGAL